MRVAFLMRRPRLHGNFSVELFTQSIIENLSPGFEAVTAVSRFESAGIARRLYNIVEAALRRADVKHVTGDVNFLTYLLKRDTTVLTILDCGVISGDLDLRKRLIRLLWFTVPVHRSAVVTVISHDVKRQLLSHVRVAPEKVHVVPVAVPELYAPSPREFCSERPTLLQIGAGENKNRKRLIEAVAGMSCRLVLVGRLSDADRTLLEAHQIDFDNHVGVSNEAMLQLYRDCDIVAFPSTFEGFGMPIIEGHRVGRPVLAGNVTSMPEVAGGAACLVDPFDVGSIRAGIIRIRDDREYREALVRDGFENAKRYCGAAIARQYEALYLQITSGCS